MFMLFKPSLPFETGAPNRPPWNPLLGVILSILILSFGVSIPCAYTQTLLSKYTPSLIALLIAAASVPVFHLLDSSPINLSDNEKSRMLGKFSITSNHCADNGISPNVDFKKRWKANYFSSDPD